MREYRAGAVRARSTRANARAQTTTTRLEEATMLQLWRLPGAMVELMVGTMIVVVHLGLAGAYANRALSGPRAHRGPVLFD
jgi:hypothetical protein